MALSKSGFPSHKPFSFVITNRCRNITSEIYQPGKVIFVASEPGFFTIQREDEINKITVVQMTSFGNSKRNIIQQIRYVNYRTNARLVI